jgi:hypothetical protein
MEQRLCKDDGPDGNCFRQCLHTELLNQSMQLSDAMAVWENIATRFTDTDGAYNAPISAEMLQGIDNHTFQEVSDDTLTILADICKIYDISLDVYMTHILLDKSTDGNLINIPIAGSIYNVQLTVDVTNRVWGKYEARIDGTPGIVGYVPPPIINPLHKKPGGIFGRFFNRHK